MGVAQILGSFILQGFLDWNAWSRQKRMYISFACIVAYIAMSWMFGGCIQYYYGVSSVRQALDFAGEMQSPIPAMICLFLWGFVDSFVQVWSYWVMGQLSDQPEELACFTAFYKLWQNAGAFASFLLGVFVKNYTLDYWVNIALILLLIAPTFLASGASSLATERCRARNKLRQATWTTLQLAYPTLQLRQKCDV